MIIFNVNDQWGDDFYITVNSDEEKQNAIKEFERMDYEYEIFDSNTLPTIGDSDLLFELIVRPSEEVFLFLSNRETVNQLEKLFANLSDCDIECYPVEIYSMDDVDIFNNEENF